MYDIHYGTGDVYGFYSVDDICIEGPLAKSDDSDWFNASCTNMIFANVVKVTEPMKIIQASGIVGMRPVSGNEDYFLNKL